MLVPDSCIAAGHTAVPLWLVDGTNLYIKRLERGRFIWPSAADGVAMLACAP